MCPLCIGTATFLVSSGTSAGGIAAVVFRLWNRKNTSIAPSTDDCGRVHAPPCRIMSTEVRPPP